MDLADYLFAPGIVPADDPLAPNTSPMDSLRLYAKAAAAAAAWEGMTDWRPYLAGAPQTRLFDPLWQGGLLELPAGLLTLTTLTTGVLNGAGGTVRTAGTDFRLMPLTAPQDNQPYTAIQWGAAGTFFTTPGWGGRDTQGYGAGLADATFLGLTGQTAITGVWGRTLTLADDDFQAILEYAAYLCYPQLSLMISKGLYSARDLNFEMRYGGGKETPVSGAAATWKANFTERAQNRRRVSII